MFHGQNIALMLPSMMVMMWTTSTLITVLLTQRESSNPEFGGDPDTEENNHEENLPLPERMDLLMHHMIELHDYSLDHSKNITLMLEEHQMEMDQLKDKVVALEDKVADFHVQIKSIGMRTQPSYSDCSEVPHFVDGVHGVYLPGDPVPKHVFCDHTTADGGWLVFQRRMDGYENFARNWNDYAHGFGNLNAEFWLGNDLLSALTTHKRYRLRIDMEDFEGEWRYAEYENIQVDNARNYYRMRLGNYSGNAGDSLTYHNGSYFSTADRDFDVIVDENCAARYHGGWWYDACHQANLNGAYLGGRHPESVADGIKWTKWHGSYSLKTTEMKIRPMDYGQVFSWP